MKTKLYRNGTGLLVRGDRGKNGTETVLISPLQNAWHVKHSMLGAPVFIMVYDPDARTANVFHGTQTPKLRQKDTSKVKALWSGPVARAPAALIQVIRSSQTPKLQQNRQKP